MLRRFLRWLRQLMLRLWRILGSVVNALLRIFVNRISVTTVRGPAPTACGGFDWQVAFTLARASRAGGWIIQQVDEDRDIYRCDHSADDVRSLPTFWEAWEVRAGKRIDHERDQGNFDFDDQFNENDHPDRYGSIYIRGTLRFFEGAALPADMVPNNPDTPAGDLPSSRTRPPFFSTFGATFHDLLAIWNCCKTPPEETRLSLLPRRGRTEEPSASPTRGVDVSEISPNARGVLEAIASVPAWTEGPYDAAKAGQLAAAAERCREVSPRELRQAVAAFYEQNRRGADTTRELSRVYLLLRAVFRVPETVDRRSAKVFGGWGHPSTFSEEPTFRLAWPVRVGEDGAVRVDDYQSYRGRPYSALREHDYFAERFERRT